MIDFLTKNYKIKQTNNLINEKFILICIVITFILWVLSINHAKLNLQMNGIKGLGLITILPISYFISFNMLIHIFMYGLLTDKYNKKILYLCIILLITYIYLTPIFIENYRGRYAFDAYGNTNYIIENGRINPQEIIYYNWPSFNILTLIFIIFTKFNPKFLINLSYIVIPFILFFLLISFSNKLNINDRERFFMIFIYFVMQWVSRDFLSSQTIGYTIYLIIFILIIRVYLKSNSNIFNYFMIILLFFTITAGHFLTSLII